MINYNPYEKKHCIAPLVGAALVSGGAGLLGSLFTSSQAKKNQEKQNQFNAEQARIDREWRESMWNKENEYNTPSAQLSRIREAGLSPGLMYQNGGSFAEASVPSGSQARAAETQRTYFDPSLAVQMALQAMQTESNIKSQKQQAKTSAAQEEVYKEEARGKEIENNIKEHNAPFDMKIKEYEEREKLFNRNLAIELHYQSTIKTQQMEQDLQKAFIDLEWYEKEKDINYKTAVQSLENANKITRATVEKLHADAFSAFAQGQFYRAQKVGVELDNELKRRTIEPKAKQAVQEYIAAQKQVVILLEKGQQEAARTQWLIANKHLADEMSTNAEFQRDKWLSNKAFELLKQPLSSLSGK